MHDVEASLKSYKYFAMQGMHIMLYIFRPACDTYTPSQHHAWYVHVCTKNLIS